MHRREFLRLLNCAATLPLLRGAESAATTPMAEIRIGLTPVFLDDQLHFLKRLRDYFADRLETPVRFVHRGSYREIVEQIRAGKIDFAWLCGFPYVRFRKDMKLLAVPLYYGNPLYQSYFIVPASDTTTTSLLDLRGKMFAYSDPDSNSGYLYPQYQLLRAGEDPTTFFSRTFSVVSELKKIAPKMKLLEKQSTKLEAEKTAQVVSDWIAKYQTELKGIVSASSELEAAGYPSRRRSPDCSAAGPSAATRGGVSRRPSAPTARCRATAASCLTGCPASTGIPA